MTPTSRLPKDVARLLRTFSVGERVVAECSIFYLGVGNVGEVQINEGERGTVTDVVMTGLVKVRWDVQRSWDQYHDLDMPTSINNLDPVDGGPS